MARREAQGHPRRPYRPPHGYPKAKERLLQAGHKFERARREWGFEEGVFIDGAFVGSCEVIALAEMSSSERKQWLVKQREATKDHAVAAVEAFMDTMHVNFEDLCRSQMQTT